MLPYKFKGAAMPLYIIWYTSLITVPYIHVDTGTQPMVTHVCVQGCTI